MNPLFTRVGGQALDGEVVCRRCDKALNRTDLNCWSCGSRELVVVGAALKQLRTPPEEPEPPLISKATKATFRQHSPICLYRKLFLSPCLDCKKLKCQGGNRCAACFIKRGHPTYTPDCPLIWAE